MNKKILWLGTGFVLLSVLATATADTTAVKTEGSSGSTVTVVTEGAVTTSAITESAVTASSLSEAGIQVYEEKFTTEGIITVDKKKFKIKNEKFKIDSKYEAEEGMATWYGGRFNGRKTTNGEIFDTNKFTAAHRTIPFGTLVKVTNLRNGEYVIVKINDRCHAAPKRIRIDLTHAAYKKIATKKDDELMKVKIEVLKPVE